MISDDAIAHVRKHMRHGEVLFRIKTTAMFIFGVPLSCVGPLFLSFAFWVCAWRFCEHPVRWVWFFWGAVVVIPLLYRLEIRTRGDYLGTVAAAGLGFDMSPGMLSVYGPCGPILGIAAVAATRRRRPLGLSRYSCSAPVSYSMHGDRRGRPDT